jgi:16S rRNA (guanine966-N2)-methyltransferase
MRVIAGKYKGRKLNAPSNYEIRPTGDKVKEAMFSILLNHICGSRVLDLFSGTGSLGIEALSRGADYCVFADSSRESISLIKENIAHCKIEEENRVLPGDYRKILEVLTNKVAEGLEKPFDIIILDPPYNTEMLGESFAMIGTGGLLAKDGVIMAEHRKEEKLPDEFHGFTKEKYRRYGVVILSVYSSL